MLALSQYVQHTYAAELLASQDGRGVGYLLKDRVGDIEEFIGSLRRVAAGGTVVDPEVVRQLMQRSRDPLNRLSPREREVLALVAEGQSNKAIGVAMGLSALTVKSHLARIARKLGTGDRAGMVAVALRTGIIH